MRESSRVRVVVVYFRSGGTLLNRCLAAMPNTVVMSEVGPLKNDVARQADEWYGIQLKSKCFLDSVHELNEICELTDRRLVLRLWVVGEFASGRKHSPPPTYELTGYRLLKESFDRVDAVALVRDPIDIWISRGCRSEGFFTNYRRYVECLMSEEIPTERYEDLCRDPDGTLTRICHWLDIPFDANYARFHEIMNVRGDMGYSTSRGSDAKEFVELKRKRIARSYRHFINNSEDMRVANQKLSYPTTYESIRRESFVKDFYRRVRHRLKLQ